MTRRNKRGRGARGRPARPSAPRPTPARAAPTAERPAVPDRPTRLPWWFWVLFVAAVLGLVAQLPVRAALGADTTDAHALMWPSLLVLLVLPRLLQQTHGVRFSRRTFDLPSARWGAVVLAVALVAGVLGVVALTSSGRFPAAWVVAGATTAVVVGAMVAVQRGVLAGSRAG